MKEKKELSKTQVFREWLEQLQQESWQLELLISGFALYGVYGAGSLIDRMDALVGVHDTADNLNLVLGLLLTVFKAGWLIFFINLLLHIILRGLWIGAIGLRYVSQDIDYDHLNYSDWMTDYLKRRVGSYDDYIERLERLCSVIFAYTFLLFFLFLSATIFLGEIAMVSTIISKISDGPGDATTNMVVGFVLFLFIVGGLIVFVDFISLGAFKRVKDRTFSRIYGVIYRFYSYATLSFAYRALLYNFLDNKYTRKLFFFSIPYIAIMVFILPTLYLNGQANFPIFKGSSRKTNSAMEYETVRHRYYDSEREQRLITGFDRNRTKIQGLSIPDYEIKSNDAIRVFFPMFVRDSEYLSRVKGFPALYNTGLMMRFKSVANDKSILEATSNKEDEVIKSIVAKKKTERDALKAGGNFDRDTRAALNAKYDVLFDSVHAVYRTQYILDKQDQMVDMKAALVDLMELSIDDAPMDLDVEWCRFFTHSNLGEKGLLCYVPTEGLDKGPHVLSLRREYYQKRDKMLKKAYSNYIVPFMYLPQPISAAPAVSSAAPVY